MIVSDKLANLFLGLNCEFLKSFFDTFSIEFLLHVDGPTVQYTSLPKQYTIKAEDTGCYFYTENKLCIMYRVTEDEVIEKYQRFLKIKAFI